MCARVSDAQLLVQALKGIRHKFQLSMNFGIKYDEGDPVYVHAACEASLKRLDGDYIDLYYQNLVDTRVPIKVIVRFPPAYNLFSTQIVLKFQQQIQMLSMQTNYFTRYACI
ncbi:hypothetical protein GOP47_0016299 [Adiantum capillus-veneris]|uniref:Uncharacterized protein n=1 Tax=Adiantum capillus-veneris TaxID=13818 RepID=A0A9D4UHE5_ADICA|nr:hypothetical protein GOP47_0016299 [Adiantum capillus-veneris]